MKLKVHHSIVILLLASPFWIAYAGVNTTDFCDKYSPFYSPNYCDSVIAIEGKAQGPDVGSGTNCIPTNPNAPWRQGFTISNETFKKTILGHSQDIKGSSIQGQLAQESLGQRYLTFSQSQSWVQTSPTSRCGGYEDPDSSTLNPASGFSESESVHFDSLATSDIDVPSHGDYVAQLAPNIEIPMVSPEIDVTPVDPNVKISTADFDAIEPNVEVSMEATSLDTVVEVTEVKSSVKTLKERVLDFLCWLK